MPGRSNRLTWTASGSSGDSPTWNAASKFWVLSQCRPTVAGQRLQVDDVDAGRVEAGHDRALDHAVRLAGLARGHDRRAALERRADRRAEPHRDLGRQIDVDEAGDRVAREQARRRARLPDQALVQLRPGLDLLVRVDPHVRIDHRLGSQRHLVADRDALVDAHVRADVALPSADRALDGRVAPDVRAGVDHAARDARVLAERDAGREHRVRPDDRVGCDAAVGADERRALDALDVVDLDPLPHPDVAAQLEAGNRQPHALVQRVEVRLPVLVEVADVLPVALADVPVQRPPHLEQQREQLLGEVVRAVLRDVPQAPRARARRSPC